MPKIVPKHPVIQTNINTQITKFYPTAFLICDAKSTTSTAIHTSELVPHGWVDTVHDILFDALLDKVSVQLGFDVKGRIHAVVPMALANAFVEKDFMMKVDGEEEWRAVVQLWQNAEEKTCVFIIKGEVDGEVVGEVDY